MRYPPQPGRDQPKGYLFLSHAAYSPHECISLNGLHTLHSEGTFMPPQSNTPPKLSGTMAILIVFQAGSRHKRIINVYMGLVVRCIDSHLYSSSQVNDFIQDIGVTSGQCTMLSRLGTTLEKGAPIAFLWTISAALCPSPQTLPIAWCTPPVTSKASSPIISTLATAPWGHACIILYATPPCSSAMMIPNSALNM